MTENTAKANPQAINITVKSTEGDSLTKTLGRYAFLPLWAKIAFVTAITIAIFFFIFYRFGLHFGDWVIEDPDYYYLLYVLLMFGAFLIVPMRKKDKQRLPWYDVVFAVIISGICIYYVLKAETILSGFWEPPNTLTPLVLAYVVLLLALESGRRIGGIPFLTICLVFGGYPLYAQWMPGAFEGRHMALNLLVAKYAYSGDGLLGLPARVNGDTLMGYLIFSGTMVASGAGKFFIDISLALFGRFRGGPAKVAVISSALFGSLNGAPVSNVVSTGSVTIPAMKQIGYSPEYAGAIEACASTGGGITPPVMGTIAFIMAVLTGIAYGDIIIAAIIPAFLYFFCLLVQVDGYAARNGLRGLPKEQVPSVWPVFKRGWPFLFSFALLMVLLTVFNFGVKAPIYSAASMILLSFVNRETMITPKRLVNLIASVGTLICWMMAILMPVGLIVLGLGKAGTVANLIIEITSIGGGNVILILVITAVASYVLGMIGMALIPYLFLAVTMAPAVIRLGELDPMAVHLFLIYYVVLTGITPPVAIVAFVAANIAGAPPMKTAITSLRLGIVLIFVPFIFVLQPALILKGTGFEIGIALITALLGIWWLASGLEGYLLWVGKLKKLTQPLVAVGGLMVALPLDWYLRVIGFGMVVAGVLVTVIARRALPNEEVSG